MKKNKNKKNLILTIIGVILLVVLLIFILNYSKDDATFSLIEKKWITDNENNVIDVSIYNDVPIFGEGGQGIAFDYLESFTDKYNIDFNKVSYLSDNTENLKNVSFKILNSDAELENSDILLYEDAYVVISLNTSGIDKISDLSNLEIGVLEQDLSLVSYYLVDAREVNYKSYKSASELFAALSNEDIKYAIVPKGLYLDDILRNNLNILMKRLSIITIVLSLPTLIASIWGMNFVDLPLEETPYGFYIVLGIALIFTIVGAIFVLFVSKNKKPKK